MTMSRDVRPEPYHLGLIGWPLAHSHSPVLHNAALRAAGLVGEYRVYPVRPGRGAESRLEELLSRLRCDELDGLNITIPYKQAVLPHLDSMTPTARAIGAVNTVLRSGGRLLGENTDAPGFLADLHHLGEMDRGSAVVLGAGGAARAVVYALNRAGWVVHVLARRLEQAQQLVNDLRSSSPKLAVEIFARPMGMHALETLPPALRLIVNTTPLGMAPDHQASPWPAELPFPPQAVVYDLVYNPPETELVRAARSAGLRARTGMGMLVEQAALSFEMWTGHPANREAMWSGLDSG